MTRSIKVIASAAKLTTDASRSGDVTSDEHQPSRQHDPKRLCKGNQAEKHPVAMVGPATSRSAVGRSLMGLGVQRDPRPRLWPSWRSEALRCRFALCAGLSQFMPRREAYRCSCFGPRLTVDRTTRNGSSARMYRLLPYSFQLSAGEWRHPSFNCAPASSTPHPSGILYVSL